MTVKDLYCCLLTEWANHCEPMFPRLSHRIRQLLADPHATETDYADMIGEVNNSGGPTIGEPAEYSAETTKAEQQASASSNVGPPRKLLEGWRDITKSLGQNYSDRDRIKSLNQRFEGPIRDRGKGTRPMVDYGNLIDWWNELAIQQEELANKRVGRELSAKVQYPYGRQGTAAPEIGGGIRQRRQGGRPGKATET
jgi:hypothetical protein